MRERDGIEGLRTKADVARFLSSRERIARTPDHYRLPELATAPDAPPSDQVVLYAEDDGAGKTKLMARFATGTPVQIAVEP